MKKKWSLSLVFPSFPVGKVASHEVGHCLRLPEAKYNDVDKFVAEEDGIMGWEPDWPKYEGCAKSWHDLIHAHSSPDRFSYQNIRYLRENATD